MACAGVVNVDREIKRPSETYDFPSQAQQRGRHHDSYRKVYADILHSIYKASDWNVIGDVL